MYGPTPGPELRLVTCGGAFDRRTGHYRDNLVVFAVAAPSADPLPRSAAD
ncbi:class F sortase [Micromonospora sp. U56]|nr:class F sortase [Micromonospora sp. U56]